MRKKSILKKARYLSQAEETSCILDKQYSETKENEDSSSSEKSKLNTEIRTFDEDTNNELYFYLDDEEINNSTEKCQKSSSYVNWRGMDFVNLVLNEETDHNISSLVNCWNEKQKSLEKKIQDKTSSTCILKSFDYCGVLKKNDDCTNPYKDSDLPGLISLPYIQLNESDQEQNKRQIIYNRLTKFTDITNDISNYYYKVYEANKSQLNCGKWSMYIHKRGKQFVNMVYYEFYSEETFRNHSTNIWNDYSTNKQNSILNDTGNRCNMTSLIYQIKERQDATDPYDMSWIPLEDHDESDETLDPTTSLPYNAQPPMESSDTSHPISVVDPLNEETKAKLGVFRDSKNATLNAISSPDDADKASAAEKIAKAATTVSLGDPPQRNSLISNSTNGHNSSITETTILPSTDDNSILHTTIVESPESNATPSTTVPSPETTPSHTTMLSADSSSSSSGISSSPITESGNFTANDGASPLNGTHSINRHSSPAMDMPESPTPISVQPITLTEINSNGTTSFSNESLTESPNSKPPVEAHIPSIKTELPKNDIVSPSSFKSLAPLDIKAFPNNTNESTTINNDIQLSEASYSPTQSSENTLTSIAKPINSPLIEFQNNTLSNCSSNCPTNMNVPDSTTAQTPLDESLEPTPTINPAGSIITGVSVGIFILGIVLLLIIIYRCTPIGSWIRNRKSKKKKIRKKIKKISKKPMPSSTNNIEDGPMNSGNHSLLQHEKQIPQCEVSFESEGNFKHEQMGKSKELKGIYNEKGNIRICDDKEKGSNMHENKFIDEEKLNTDNPKSEIKKEKLSGNEPSSENEDEYNKNILEKDPVHIVCHIRNGTLNEEKANEINSQKEKSTCEIEMKNLGNKTSVKNDVCNWNSWVDIHMTALLECKKEEWKLNKIEFFNICLEEIEKDGENSNLKEMRNHFIMKIKEENSNDKIVKKSSILEKYKNEKWFINLKKEWKEEQEKYLGYLDEQEIEKMTEMGVNNFMLDKKKKIWKKWIEWQIEHSYEYKNQKWFVQLLEEYEKEEIDKNLKEENIEKERNNGIDKNEMKKNLERRILLDIHMMVLEECTKEEWEKEEEFFKANMEEIKIYKNLDEETNILDKIEREGSWNVISEIEKEEIEKWKNEKWFIELIKEEWLLNRGKFLETCLEEFIEEDKEKYPKIIENELAMMKEGEEDISTLMIEKQKLLWNKWVERNKRMSEKWKNEEWFINLKKEWGKEQEKYDELTKESEISEIEAGKNPMLEKQKRIWKQWLKKQRKWFILHGEEDWFNNLLDEYEKEEEREEGITKKDRKEEKEIHENIEELKQEADEEIEKNRKKREKLIQNILIDIHMTLLEECMKEELQKEKEYFFKKMVEELRIQENLNEDVNILEIKKKSRNVILNNDKEKIEEWKKKKWFIELILEMKNKEKEYIKDIYEEMIAKKNEDRIRNPMLERQKIIWKKHCEDIHKRWIEKNNKECFTTVIYY
ncbi:surface-associated interspersed protein (SURFIN) [Plasmodium gallinaceum]|uniref:Surface-associated interspersed protein (SURFIN) n=1 Tax=Plasmodium gallinaceum TaxID=5849 RepID=A0A1J1GSL5_PLAGA|nr:surface-associated interspersed protein (SURFIN) [Plasmodium gallinaceum]CRG95517.1 surface-associated interspersed protein (SURFIN) [Plasmodium gallinaceum]